MQASANNNTLDLETMIKRLSIFSTIDLYLRDESDEEEQDSLVNKKKGENDNSNADFDNSNTEPKDNDENDENSLVLANDGDEDDDSNTKNLENYTCPLNIVIDPESENKYNNGGGMFLKEISKNNNYNSELALIEENYKLKLKKYENENLSLKKEINELKNIISNSQYLNNSKFNETALLDQIDKLKNENKILNEDLNKLKQINSDLTDKVQNLQKYEDLYKSKEFFEINTKLYQVVSKIGQGGFSEVYHCISFKESKSYALKKVLINDEQNFNFVMNEINLLLRLQSTEKVIKLFDYEYVKTKKTLFIVMELGSTDLNNFIKKEIQKHICVREPTRVYIWFKMLEAVKAIHKQGVIHSDLKPANFLLVGHEIKLIDFNISNTINDRTSVTVVCDCGTLNYMPPESFKGDDENKAKVNQKSDVWSLGCILYLMVYGKLPFQHIKNQYQLIYTLADANKVIEFATIQDKSLLDVLKKCLQHEPIKRYSVDELLNHPYIMSKQ